MNSSWIDSTKYKSFPDGSSYLAIFLRPGHGAQVLDNTRQDVPTALLYGPKVPSWLPGLVAAGTGRRSIGLAFNKLVKGKYEYQRVVGGEQVEQLKEMLK